MPKLNPLQSNFNAGEASPLVQFRTDSPRYKQALAIGLNMLPTLQGPALRRPGSKNVQAVKDSTKPPTCIPFKYSATQNYVLEFGDYYIRFYSNEGQVVVSGTLNAVGGVFAAFNTVFNATRANVNPLFGEFVQTASSLTPGDPLELYSPYSYLEAAQLKFCQDASILYLFHPNHRPFRIDRFSAQEFRMMPAIFQDGPYMPLNSYNSLGDWSNVNLTVGTITAPNSFAVSASAGGSTISGAASASGLIRITTSSAHGLLTGQYVYISGVVGTVEANSTGSGGQPYYWVINLVDATHFDLIGSTFVNAYSSGGSALPAPFGPDYALYAQSLNPPNLGRLIAFIMSGLRYWGWIRTFTSPSAITVMVGSYGILPIASAAATAWQVGCFSGCNSQEGAYRSTSIFNDNAVNLGNGFPSAGCFHQGRLALVGAPRLPQQMDLSCVQQYEIFAPSPASTNAAANPPTTALVPADNNAISEVLKSNDSNVLYWVASTAQGLLAGSSVSEWTVTPNSQSNALTPTNFNAQEVTFFGSANIQPVKIGNGVFYIQRAQRKVRELLYFFQVGTFRSIDMTELSEHITVPTINYLAVQKETHPLIWAIRSDGALISMTYNRDDVSLVAGWMRHFLGGQSDSGGTPPVVTSIAVIPSKDGTYDQLWMIVKRYINGSTTYSIEYLTKPFDDSILQEDAFQGDNGATYDNPKTITAITAANPGVVTSASHGFSNGDQIRIENVIGMNSSVTDSFGNKTVTNAVNNQTFVVASKTTNTFQLNDFNGNPVTTVPFSAYLSGGQVRKLVTTISGLTWLENETVSILADGGSHPDVVVSNSGAITLKFPAAKVQIGYSFNSDGQLLRSAEGSAQGSSIGSTRRTSRVAFGLYRTGQLLIGTDFLNLFDCKFMQADQQKADNSVPLYTGIHRDGLESAYDFESQVCFRQNSMLPGMIQGITTFVEEFDI